VLHVCLVQLQIADQITQSASQKDQHAFEGQKGGLILHLQLSPEPRRARMQLSQTPSLRCYQNRARSKTSLEG
jgi:hypothetical protein